MAGEGFKNPLPPLFRGPSPRNSGDSPLPSPYYWLGFALTPHRSLQPACPLSPLGSITTRNTHTTIIDGLCQLRPATVQSITSVIPTTQYSLYSCLC